MALLTFFLTPPPSPDCGDLPSLELVPARLLGGWSQEFYGRESEPKKGAGGREKSESPGKNSDI